MFISFGEERNRAGSHIVTDPWFFPLRFYQTANAVWGIEEPKFVRTAKRNCLILASQIRGSGSKSDLEIISFK